LSHINYHMSEAPRAPTPAVYRTSPLYDIYGQTLHPYINQKTSGITPYLCTPFFTQLPSSELLLLLIPLPSSKSPPLTVLVWDASMENAGLLLTYSCPYSALPQLHHQGPSLLQSLRPPQESQILSTRRISSDLSSTWIFFGVFPSSLHPQR
jgi:hypothetical protein